VLHREVGIGGAASPASRSVVVIDGNLQEVVLASWGSSNSESVKYPRIGPLSSAYRVRGLLAELRAGEDGQLTQDGFVCLDVRALVRHAAAAHDHVRENGQRQTAERRGHPHICDRTRQRGEAASQEVVPP
jgi:hypothetical protein